MNDAVNVTWKINATSSGTFNVSVFANGTSGVLVSNDTRYSGVFKVYKLLKENCPNFAENQSVVTQEVCSQNATIGQGLDNSSLEAMVGPWRNLTASWSCEAGNYRVAELGIVWEGNLSETKAAVYVYNGTGWSDIYRQDVGKDASLARLDVRE